MSDWFDQELQKLNIEMIKQACATLSKSEKGRQSLADLFTFVDRSKTLDDRENEAILILISSCLQGQAVTAYSAMADRLIDLRLFHRCAACENAVAPPDDFCLRCKERFVRLAKG